MNLNDFKVLTFDCYGTMIDWETGIWDAYQPLITASGRSDVTRQIALETHARVESALQAQDPGHLYPDLLNAAHRGVARELGLETSDELNAAFGASLNGWPAFADSADALRRLKRHYKLVILSNVNRAGFATSNRKLGVTFDAVYTAEDVGAYKPADANFTYMLDHLKADFGFVTGDVLHTAQSLFHDHVPATRFALAKAWIDRQGLSTSDNWGATAKVAERPSVDFLFPTLAAMADAVDSASR